MAAWPCYVSTRTPSVRGPHLASWVTLAVRDDAWDVLCVLAAPGCLHSALGPRPPPPALPRKQGGADLGHRPCSVPPPPPSPNQALSFPPGSLPSSQPGGHATPAQEAGAVCRPAALPARCWEGGACCFAAGGEEGVVGGPCALLVWTWDGSPQQQMDPRLAAWTVLSRRV